jgi:hypothetical protein
MPRAFVLFFRSGCMVLAALVLSGCSSSNDVQLASVTITGVPAAALRPGQTVQLTATAAYSDGGTQDVTSIAIWSTTDASVLTVSSTGVVTAQSGGQAEVVAAFRDQSARVSLRVTLPAAYFIDGVEYAFDYQLDAQGRIISYGISQRAGVTYPYPPEQDDALITCTGSLQESFECRHGPSPQDGATRLMRGEAGRITYAESKAPMNVGATATFTYGAQGLAMIASRLQPRASIHTYQVRTTEVTYDAAGRPALVTLSGTDYCTIVCRELGTTSQVAFDGQGRMLRAESASSDRTLVMPITWTYFATDWSYSIAGAMTLAASATPVPEITRFVADAEGWLTSRTEHAGTPNETTDTFAIVRAGAAVAEERFTQAEPRLFYRRGTQRVRYDVDRLPTRPAFVPRAPNGQSAADLIATVPASYVVTFP